MLLALSWPDYAVIGAYLALTLVIGAYAARRQRGDEEYFLAGRRMPWMAVGFSILATLMSSLTYLSEPGEVWQSGVTNFLAKASAILIEMLLVWFFFIPFLMRFRFTSAYEYLGHRFGPAARRLGVVLFLLLTVSWMGFVVLTMSRAIAQVAGLPLELVITTLGVVTTAYTVMGGLRAVVWTDVAQVVLMVGGCVVTLLFVGFATGTWLPDWLRASNAYLANRPGGGGVTFFSADPFHRTSIVTAAVSMLVWNMVTHVGNQMMVQRYFATSDVRSARRSFATATVLHVLVNGLLACAGLAVLYYYVSGHAELRLDPHVRSQGDQVFPRFMVEVLPPGLTGAVLAAVLAAAMSTIDSGINSLATVLAVERRRGTAARGPGKSQVRFAQGVTLVAGVFITLAAYGLDRLTAGRNILEMMPRTFNCFVVPMGGMFLLGMFLPFCNGAGAVLAALAGLFTSVSVSYARELYGLERDISFTWVLPSALVAMLVTAVLVRLLTGPPPVARTSGLTWGTRREWPAIDPSLIAPEAARGG